MTNSEKIKILKEWDEREKYLRDKYEFYYDFWAEDGEDEIVVIEKDTGRRVQWN